MNRISRRDHPCMYAHMHRPCTQTTVWGRPGRGWRGAKRRNGDICTNANNKKYNKTKVTIFKSSYIKKTK